MCSCDRQRDCKLCNRKQQLCLCDRGKEELTRNQDCFVTGKDTVRTLTVNSCLVVDHVHFANAYLQKKGLNPNYCYLCSEIKHVNDLSWVDQSSSVKKSHKCPSCCTRSACRSQITPVLEKMGSSRHQPQSINSPQRRLHSPLRVPAKFDQVTHHNKLLCKSPQELLPVGGIGSAVKQKCSRVGQKSRISGLLQPTILGTKTQQPVETYLGPKYPE